MTANTGQAERRGATRRLLRSAAWLVLLTLAIGLRLWRRDTDAFRGLSSDPGLFTDEGFYTHSARNAALFGHAQTDDFNNALLMPTLHYLQVIVFHWFGYGVGQARLISIALGLLTLPVFFAAMKRMFGGRVAGYAVLFLGLEHVPLLYSRMALMDTAAAFLLVGAFACFAFARTTEGRKAALFAAGCGLTLGILYATRALAAVGMVAPFVALAFPLSAGTEPDKRAGRWKFAAAVFGGLLLALALYGILWYRPHAAALSHVSRFHLRGQLLPKSLAELAGNLLQAIAGTRPPGLLPYLAAHSPVLLLLAASLPFVRRGNARLSDVEARGLLYLAAWLLAFFALFAFASYAPSRYYVLFYPALCGLAAFSLRSHADRAVNDPSDAPAANRSATGTGIAGRRPIGGTPDRRVIYGPVAVARIVLFIWAIINLAWYANWAGHFATTQKDASQLLARTLPPDSVLLGDCAPGLGIYNRFVTVNVMPGLCNDRNPLERFAGRPRYVVILDGPYKTTNEKWWAAHYPKVMDERNRVFLFDPLVSHPIGVYQVRASDVGGGTDEGAGNDENARSNDDTRRHARGGR